MSTGVRVEVHVRGHLGGDLLAMVEDLNPQVVPRHTVFTVRPDAGPHDLVGVLHALERAGIELDRVEVAGERDTTGA